MSSCPPHGRFASNAAEAEAGAQLRLSPAAESGKTEEFDQGDESLGTDVDGPFSQYCTDNATVWKLYMDQARISDDNLANIFNSDLDPLLIFAGLFSAILSAFLIERNSTGLTPSSSRFEPSLSLRWVNGLWFSSLMFSLMSALGASLAKGWVTQFSSSVSGSSWGDAAVHCSRWRGLKRWHLKLIIQSLPIPIHIAFFLFSVGLIILIFQDDTVIGVVIFALTAFIVLLYIGSSIHPAYSADSPFRTPVSWLLRHLLTGSWHLEPVYGFPSQKDSQKAQALAWLLMESPSADTITAAVRAIAGLPTNLFVQDELLRGPTVHPLLRMLSIELAKGRPEPLVLSSCLYTLLHLVQAVSTDPGDESSSALRASIKPGGPLFSTDLFPSDVREIGICVKARIMLLLCDRTSEATLFNTDIPVLIKSSANDHLRRLLFEVEVLMRPHGKLTATESGNDFLSILRDRNALNRIETHDKVVKAAMLERRLNDSVSQFGARTLLKGVATGSTELRRKYARLFAELATHGAFRTEMLNIGSENEICSLLKVEDDEVHEYIAVALIHFSADDNTRKMVTQGLPAVIINCLPNEAPRIIRFLVQVTSYDDVRAGVTAELLVHYLLGLIGGSPPVNADARDSVLTLAQYEDIRAAISTSITTQKIMLMLQHTDPCVRYWTLEIIIGLAQYGRMLI
ncbi:hypothetical protein C8J57DRAFT_544643 [Mycena rebaudengoi]|nr:hypothetical protein C8J57DRAFT_544643 [Mycena rebaudengoi]